MEGYDESTYGERWADVYDEWYETTLDTDATVRFIDELVRRDGGPAPAHSPALVLELGVGTGRVAIPLAALGHDVRGIDASPAMLQRLQTKPGGDAVAVRLGDMADVALPPRRDEPDGGPDAERCAVVFATDNTFFNLSSPDAQRRCLTRIAAVLQPAGSFVCSAFVPDPAAPSSPRGTIGVRSMTTDRVVLTVDVHDIDEQQVRGQFIDITSAGIALRPFVVRYLLPAQLDELARSCGLELVERFGSWARADFDEDAATHVSVYRRAR